MSDNRLIGRGLHGWQFHLIAYLHAAGHITIDPIYSNHQSIIDADINWKNLEYGAKCLLIITPDMLASIVTLGADIKSIIYQKTANPRLYANSIVDIINYGFPAYLDIAEYNKWNKLRRRWGGF